MNEVEEAAKQTGICLEPRVDCYSCRDKMKIVDCLRIIFQEKQQHDNRKCENCKYSDKERKDIIEK